MELAPIFTSYAITFGWAIVGSVSMGVGVFLALKIFTISTREVDEWKLIKEGNLAMAIILAALVISVGIVVASVTKAG